MTTAAVLDGAVIALSWTAMLFRLPSLRATHHAVAARWLWLYVFGLSLAVTLRLPALYGAVGRAAGVPDLAWLLQSVAVLASAWAMLAVLAHLREPTVARRSIRRWGLLTGATVGVMTSLFVVAARQSDTAAFVTRSTDAAPLAVCVMVYLAVVGLASVRVVGAFWGFARLADRGPLRSGLWLTAVGGTLGMAALVHYGLILIAHQVRFADVLRPLNVGLQVLCAGGIALVVLGASVPAWAVRLISWLRDYRDHRRLGPLWYATTRQTQRRLGAGLIDVVTFGSLHYRVYRRVRETRNAMLELQLRADPRLVATAFQDGSAIGLRGPERAAYAEAHAVFHALKNQRGAGSDDVIELPAASGASDRHGEVSFLAAVGAHLTPMLWRSHHRSVPGVKTLLV